MWKDVSHERYNNDAMAKYLWEKSARAVAPSLGFNFFGEKEATSVEKKEVSSQ